MKNIATLEEGQYEVEFVREEPRESEPSTANTATQAGEKLRRGRALSRCVLRVVGTHEDLEDTSRATADSTPGTKFIATVTYGLRYAAFRPVNAPENDQQTTAGVANG